MKAARASTPDIDDGDKGISGDRPRSRTLAQDLHDNLERLIVDGTLVPGERLDEVELAERFGVSRTPVREALRALHAAGLVEVMGRQGMTVARLTISKLLEMFEMMSAMEGLCAKFSARRASVKQRTEMRAIHERLVASLASGDPATFYEVNGEFHDLLYEASGTQFIAAQTQALRRRVSPYRRHVTYQPGRMNATIAEHEAILKAIEAADAEAAQKAAIQHVLLLGDDLADFIAALPADITGGR